MHPGKAKANGKALLEDPTRRRLISRIRWQFSGVKKFALPAVIVTRVVPSLSVISA
jgi:hypothetical protein